MSDWQPIETAPKDGTLLKGLRIDTGIAFFYIAWDAEAKRWRIPPKSLHWFERPDYWAPMKKVV